MSVVRGKNGILFIDGKAIACGRSVTINTTTSLIETTTAGSGKGATFIPEKNTSTGGFEGVTFLAVDGKNTLPVLRRKQLDHELLTGTMTRTDENGNTYVDSFTLYITGVSDSCASGDFGNFNFDFQIQGDPEIDIFCTGLTQPTGMTVAINSLTPVYSYVATWAGGGGVDSFEVSTNGGATYTAKTGVQVGNTFTYNFGITDYTNHIVRIKSACQYDSALFYTATATYTFVCGLVVSGVVVSITDTGGGVYEYTATYIVTGGTPASYDIAVQTGLGAYTGANPPLLITTPANATTVKYKLNGGLNQFHNLRVTPRCTPTFAGTAGIGTWDI